MNHTTLIAVLIIETDVEHVLEYDPATSIAVQTIK